MQIFIYCKFTVHVSGVTAPIIRSTKNCNRSNSDFAVNKYLHTVASGWILMKTLLYPTNEEIYNT